jgi:uncharacterized protein (DUF2267 family)
LEYFCASEMVYQFEKQRTLSFEQLRDQVFGQHWQDETWHEVLRLICGMVDASFACQLIEFLITQKDSPVEDKKYQEEGVFKEIGQANLLLAMDCCAEVSQIASIAPTRQALLKAFQQALTQGVYWRGVEAIMNLVAKAPRFPEALPWLKDQVLNDRSGKVHFVVAAIAEHYHNDPATLPWLKEAFQTDNRERVRAEVVSAIAEHYHNDPATLPWLKEAFQADNRERVRSEVVSEIAEYYHADPATLPWLKEAFQADNRERVRSEVVSDIAEHYHDDPATLPLLKEAFQTVQQEWVRAMVVSEIARYYHDDPATLPWLKEAFQTDNRERVRARVVSAIDRLDPNDLDKQMRKYL